MSLGSIDWLIMHMKQEVGVIEYRRRDDKRMKEWGDETFYRRL